MRKYVLLFGAVMLAALLTGCAGTWETRANNALAIACDSYATLLDQVTPHKADLSAANIERIATSKDLVDKACLPGSALDPADALATVNQGKDLLKTIKEIF